MIDLVLFRIRIGSHHCKIQKGQNGLCNKTGYIPFVGESLPGQVKYAGSVCLMFFVIFIYIYILCLNFALLVDITRSDLPHIIGNIFPKFPGLSYTHPPVNLNLMQLTNALLLYIVVYAIKLLFPRIPRKFNMKCVLSYNKRYSLVTKISHFISFWLVSMNLLLITIVNPSLINPGPSGPKDNNNISVIFQNVRGLMPFTELGKPSPMLDNTKLFELQSYVYSKKIDIVILNETWLVDDINNSELFDSKAYKIFRLDRSVISHPPHPSKCQ